MREGCCKRRKWLSGPFERASNEGGIQYNTTQHNTIQYNTIQYNTNTIQYKYKYYYSGINPVEFREREEEGDEEEGDEEDGDEKEDDDDDDEKVENEKKNEEE